jgi:hypothetical protein
MRISGTFLMNAIDEAHPAHKAVPGDGHAHVPEELSLIEANQYLFCLVH